MKQGNLFCNQALKPAKMFSKPSLISHVICILEQNRVCPLSKTLRMQNNKERLQKSTKNLIKSQFTQIITKNPNNNNNMKR